jgi:hypothetical protein
VFVEQVDVETIFSNQITTCAEECMNVLPESLWMETYLQTYLNGIYFLIITKELCIARSNARVRS